MGDIGPNEHEVEFLPLEEPVQEPQQVPEREPEQVPA
jgi:hypothetical protein